MSAGETRAARESAILTRLRKGDREALGKFLDLHRERLLRMVRFRMDRRLAARVDADDVLQEAFLAANARIDDLWSKTDASPFVWIRLIVIQSLIDIHRRHLGAEMRDARRDVRLDRAGDGSSTSNCLAACLAASMTSPSRLAAGNELTLRLEAALASMSSIDREILALRHFEDLTNSECSEVLRISPTAASNRYVRALAHLKEILSPFPEFQDP